MVVIFNIFSGLADAERGLCSLYHTEPSVGINSYEALKGSGGRCCCRQGMAPRSQLHKNSGWQLHLIGDKAPPATRDNDEVVILTSETMGSFTFGQLPTLVSRNFLAGQSHGCGSVSATGALYHADVFTFSLNLV